MARFWLLSTILLFTTLAVGAAQRHKQCQRYPSREEFKECYKCTRFQPKTVTLVVRNVLRAPMFEESVTLDCTRFKTLFFMMQEAAEINIMHRFNVKYFGATMGFFIDAINDVVGTYADDKSYWSILDNDLNPTPVGISNFEPAFGDTVTFNFTRN